jgi:hypothetical protein
MSPELTAMLAGIVATLAVLAIILGSPRDEDEQ